MICLDSAAVLATYLRGGQQRGLLYAGLMTWGAGFACDLAGTQRCLAGWLAAGGLFIWLAAVETFYPLIQKTSMRKFNKIKYLTIVIGIKFLTFGVRFELQGKILATQ